MRFFSLLTPLLLGLTACGNKVSNNEGEIDDTGAVIDVDGDGSPQGEDCDDGDASAYPGADEICDGIDNDCDGQIDNDAIDGSTWYSDSDGDGYGDLASAETACDQPEGTVEDATDCNDDDDAYHPGATEDDCTDPNDYNCDGSVGYADVDGDGFAACEECDDSNAQVYPDAPEVCDGVDNDCDTLVDADDVLAKGEGGTWYSDSDSDGYGDPAGAVVACDQPEGTVEDATDCDDGDIAINPGATEVCNGADDDCDTLIDADDDSLDLSTQSTWYFDGDADGYGDDAISVLACDGEPGWTTDGGDCDDRDGTINPGAAEVCDDANVDEDCNGSADDDDSGATGQTTWYIDYDSDDFGSSAFTEDACDQPPGYVPNDADCDDTDDAINPLADEVCDGIDNDCDTLIDADDDEVSGVYTYYADSDEDGYGDADASTEACEAPDGYVDDATDCDDGNGAINPAAAEICDGGVDNDCNDLADDDDPGLTDPTTWYADLDVDGYGDPATASVSCEGADGAVDNGEDCDDGDDQQHPGADEYCNDEDDDCDDEIDEEAVDASWSYVDADGDGFGDPTGVSEWTCGAIIDNDLDCDDDDDGEPIVVATDGSSSGDGSLDSPLASIQDGIDTAYTCVVVEAGTYYEAIDFGGKDLAVASLEGAEATTIDASGFGLPAVTFDSYETDDAVLEGFTITGGEGLVEETSEDYACTSVSTCTTYSTTYCGGGVLVDGSGPTLLDLIITENTLPEYSESTSGDDTYYVFSYGGGLCALGGSSPALEGVLLADNYAEQGGGIYVDEDSSISIEQSWLMDNAAADGAGIQIDGGEAQLDNVASTWNVASGDAGALLAVDSEVVMVNVTLAGDQGSLSGAIYGSGTASMVIANSIVYTDSSVATVLADATASFSTSYSDVYNATGSAWSGVTDPTGSSGNISSDPGFSAWSDDGDSSNDDVSLGTGSVCLDAGNPDTAYNDPDGSRNDMGAYGGPGAGF